MGTTQSSTIVVNRPTDADDRERELSAMRRAYFRGQGDLEEVKRLEKGISIPGGLRIEKPSSVQED